MIKFVIVLWTSKDTLKDLKDGSEVPFYSFDELMASGRTSRQALAAVASSGVHITTALFSLSYSYRNGACF